MIYGVIMAGGSGTRFWPESRKARPKQLLKIVSEKTMIRATIERISPEIPADRVLVVTTEHQAAEIRTELGELRREMVVAEPVGRNTAACVALAAYKLQKMDPEALMVVLPADHLIGKEREFLKNLKLGIDVVSKGDYLLTFGIVPRRPETGYGYILMGGPQSDGATSSVYRVDRFVEKPDLSTAQLYVESGTYLWNSGMFVWKVADIIKAFDRYLPSLSAAMRKIVPHLNTPDEFTALKSAYDEIESVSVDYGIMEQADNVLVIPMDVDWSDVGSWSSLAEVWGEDETGNVAKGEVVALDSSGCIVSSPHKLVTLLGVEDLVVVDTPDALLICKKDRAQEVRKVQEILQKKGRQDLL